MTPNSAAEVDVARRLWARAGGGAGTPESVAAAAERVRTQLRTGLGRWVGSEGFSALLDRALGVARAEHPALGGLPGLGGIEPVTTAAVGAQGAREVAAGMVALVAALTVLLGRIIGEDMAMHLVDQTGGPSPRGVKSSEIEGGRDG